MKILVLALSLAVASCAAAPAARPPVVANDEARAKWANYSTYLQRVIDVVDLQWERILSESRVYPPSGTSATVRFVIDSEGRIARIVETKGNTTDAGKRACVSAITDRAPFGAWTDDMKAVLGSQQELTFTFSYQ